MNKNWGITSIMVGWMMFVFAWTVLADQQPQRDLKTTEETLDALVNTMEQTGATPQRIQLHYGTAYRTFRHLQEVEQFANQLGINMGLNSPNSAKNAKNAKNGKNANTMNSENSMNSDASHEGHLLPKKAAFSRRLKGVHTELQISAIPSHNTPHAWDSYLTVRMTADSNSLDELKDQLEQVQKVLENVQILPQFNSCVQGNYNGTLKNDVQLERVNQLLDILGAEVVEKAEDPTVKSFSAYTPKLKPYIWTDRKKMNVQVGLHVDHQKQVTKLTIGTPIITMEY